MKKFLWFFSLFLVVVGCRSSVDQVAMVGEGSAAIIGGKSAHVGDPIARSIVEVLLIQDSSEGEVEKSCTGVLVGKDWILTAAHCFNYNPERGQPRFEIRDSFSGQKGLVKKIKFHPDYLPSRARLGNDLALVRIEAPWLQFLEPISIVAPEAEIPQRLRVYGNGQVQSHIDPEILPKKLRHTDLLTLGSADFFLKIMAGGASFKPQIFFDQSHGSGACSGDSGGPALAHTERGWLLVGIASYVFNLQDPDQACSGIGVYSDLRGYSDWLIENSILKLRN